MFYFFSKTLAYLFSPAGWLFFGLLAALLVRKGQLKRRLLGVSLFSFWLLGNGPLTNEALRVWEVAVPRISQPENYEVAVVLTGNMIHSLYAPEPVRPVLGWEADRAGQALWLYKTGLVKKILISGGGGKANPPAGEPAPLPFQTPSAVDEGVMIRQFLLTAGVPPADILLENRSRNTHENALFSARMLRRKFETNRCVLVTSAWHMRRAAACFRHQGLQVVPWPAAQLSERRATFSGAYLLPDEKAFHDAQTLLRELAGYGAYWLAGYLDR